MGEGNMKEEWKFILGYDNYMISSHGRVKSIFIYKWDRHNNTYKKCYREKILKPTNNGNGYLIVGLCKEKGRGRKNFYVHRLVAEAFIPNPNNYKEINHKDYNKSNNKMDNLEWCNRRYNIDYSKVNKAKIRYFKKSNTGHHHVYFRKNRYEVTINRHYVGSFGDLEEAISRRDDYLSTIK